MCFLTVEEMSSSSASGTVGQLVKPDYRNWIALGHALTTELCHGLRPFINREMANFYQNLNTRLAGSGPCTCVFVPRRKRNQYHDMGTCAWAFVLQGHHHTNKPNWKQSDASKWLDPILGPWEIAKLFRPDLGGHVVIQNAEDMDVTGILNLMYFCSHFTIPQHLIKDVREIRNNKWVHVPTLELNDADKKVAFDAIEDLLKDPSLAHDRDVQKALKEIGNLKGISDLHSMEARVLADFKEVIGKEISTINMKLINLEEESQKNKEEQEYLKEQQEMLKRALAAQPTLTDVNQEKCTKNFLLDEMGSFIALVFGNLAGNIKGIRKRDLASLLMLLFLCHLYTVLDDSFTRDGKYNVSLRSRRRKG